MLVAFENGKGCQVTPASLLLWLSTPSDLGLVQLQPLQKEGSRHVTTGHVLSSLGRPGPIALILPTGHRKRWLNGESRRSPSLPQNLTGNTCRWKSTWQSETKTHASCTAGGIGGGDGQRRHGCRKRHGPHGQVSGGRHWASHISQSFACFALLAWGWLPALRDAIAVSRSNA